MRDDPEEGDSKRLVERAAAGDSVATNLLVRKHEVGLRAFVRLRMGNALRSKESSADIVQDVLLDLFRDLPNFEYRNESGFRHWLYSCAANRIADRGRHYARLKRDVQREERLDEPGAQDRLAKNDQELLQSYHSFVTPSRVVSGREELERVESAFSTLPNDYREVIVLSRIIGLSHAEVAERMERSLEAIYALLSRALARLSMLLEESDDARGG